MMTRTAEPAWLRMLPLPVVAPDDGGAGGGGEGAADKPDALGDQSVAGDQQPGDKADADAQDKTNDADKIETDSASGKDIPDNWRELAAGDDEDTLKLLKRYGSLRNVAKALREKDTFIRSGKLKQSMPDPSDEKALAEWRKSEGVPDDPTGYKLPESVTKRMTDEDKPLIASFTEFAHGKNARPDVVEIASEWYFEALEKMQAEREGADKEASSSAEDALRETWGNGSYKGNLTLAQRYGETIPGLGVDLFEFRGKDGRRLGDKPEFIEWLSDMGREKFGDVTFATSESSVAHAGRKAEIEKVMQTDINAYWADAKMQKEYADILAKEEKRK